jgi:adenosyl cobinamide kinase/adenosyl cobinamide phosphate guanylyltransferase
LNKLRQRADVFNKNRRETWYYLFSKASFTSAILEEAKKDDHVVLVDLKELLR